MSLLLNKEWSLKDSATKGTGSEKNFTHNQILKFPVGLNLMFPLQKVTKAEKAIW